MLRIFFVVAAIACVSILFFACSADDASTTADASVVLEAGPDCAALPTDVTYTCDPLDAAFPDATCNGVSPGVTMNQYPLGCVAITAKAAPGLDEAGCATPITCNCQLSTLTDAAAAFVCPS